MGEEEVPSASPSSPFAAQPPKTTLAAAASSSPPPPSSSSSETFHSLPLSPPLPPPSTSPSSSSSLSHGRPHLQTLHHRPPAAAFSRQSSFGFTPLAPSSSPSFPSLSRISSFQSQDPKSRRSLTRIVSMDRPRTPLAFQANEDVWKGQFMAAKGSDYQEDVSPQELGQQPNGILSQAWNALKSGNRGGARRLMMLIILNVAYSSAELIIGLFSGRVGLVSDAFHLTFGCGLLSFSLVAMLYTRKMHDDTYTYGYNRLEVLAAFTNALFLLFLSFSLAVEALHAFVQDESEHKHYLIVSAVTNLFVNLLGVWFFRSYARIRISYRKAEDMNYHSIFLHVLADSIRSAGLILASWLLTVGVNNAETLCLGLVAIAVFLVVMPLFKATAGVLLQMSPTGISASVFHKCLRQVRSIENIIECVQARFWEMVPGFVVGTILIQVKPGTDEQKVLKHVHSIYNDIGVKELTVQIDVKH